MSVLAIHAGASGVTALAVTADGTVAAEGHEELVQHVPRAGWVEHVAEEIWQATLRATRACLTLYAATGGPQLRAVGITNQRETVLLWDRETLGSPRRAIAGQDRRSADICARLRGAGHEDRVAGLTGLRLDPTYSGTKLVWLQDHEPNTWVLVEDGRYALGTVDSFLVARMTRGTWHVTDVSNASRTLLLDLQTGDWSDELCTLLGVPRDALPEVVPSWGDGSTMGTTDPRAFAGLELPIAGIAVDRQSALFGQTCFDVGDSVCTLDEGLSVIVNTGTRVSRPAAGLVPTAAWQPPYGGLVYAVEGVITVPDGAGSEAIASGVRELVERLPSSPALTRLAVVGDAWTDDRLCELLAERLGCPVERSRVTEAPALGAAYMAGLGVGVWSSTDDLREIRQLDRRFGPTGDRA